MERMSRKRIGNNLCSQQFERENNGKADFRRQLLSYVSKLPCVKIECVEEKASLRKQIRLKEHFISRMLMIVQKMQGILLEIGNEIGERFPRREVNKCFDELQEFFNIFNSASELPQSALSSICHLYSYPYSTRKLPNRSSNPVFSSSLSTSNEETCNQNHLVSSRYHDSSIVNASYSPSDIRSSFGTSSSPCKFSSIHSNSLFRETDPFYPIFEKNNEKSDQSYLSHPPSPGPIVKKVSSAYRSSKCLLPRADSPSSNQLPKLDDSSSYSLQRSDPLLSYPLPKPYRHKLFRSISRYNPVSSSFTSSSFASSAKKRNQICRFSMNSKFFGSVHSSKPYISFPSSTSRPCGLNRLVFSYPPPHSESKKILSRASTTSPVEQKPII